MRLIVNERDCHCRSYLKTQSILNRICWLLQTILEIPYSSLFLLQVSIKGEGSKFCHIVNYFAYKNHYKFNLLAIHYVTFDTQLKENNSVTRVIASLVFGLDCKLHIGQKYFSLEVFFKTNSFIIRQVYVERRCGVD